MRAAPEASPVDRYSRNACSRASNTVSSSSSHQAAQLSPSSLSGVSSTFNASANARLAGSHRPSASAAQPASGILAVTALESLDLCGLPDFFRVGCDFAAIVFAPA